MANQFQYGQYGNPAFGELPVDPNEPAPQSLTYPPPQSQGQNPFGQAAGTATGAYNTYQLGTSLFGGGSAAGGGAAGGGAATTGTAATSALGAGPLAIGAIGVAGTLAARDQANKQGGAVKTGWAAANVANPVNVAAEVPGAYKNITGGRGLSSTQQIGLAIPTLGASLAYNTVTGAGKHRDVYQRMGVKKALDKAGLGNQLQWQGAGGQTLDMRKAQYNTDPNNQFTTQAIDYANPFAYAFASQLGDDKNFRKMSTDLTGQIANTLVAGATSAEDVRNNILGFIQKLGIQPAQIRETIKQMIEKKLITEQEGEVFNANISNLVSGKPYQSAPAAPAQANQGKPATPMAAAVPPKGKPSTPMSK